MNTTKEVNVWGIGKNFECVILSMDDYLDLLARLQTAGITVHTRTTTITEHTKESQ